MEVRCPAHHIPPRVLGQRAAADPDLSVKVASAGPLCTVTVFLFHYSVLQKQVTKSSPYSRGRELISPSQGVVST